MIYIGKQSEILKEQIHLENRPLLGLSDIRFYFDREKGWIRSTLEQTNYGIKPAVNVFHNNFRVLPIRFRQEVLKKKYEADKRTRFSYFDYEFYHKELVLIDIRNYLQTNEGIPREVLEKELSESLEGQGSLFKRNDFYFAGEFILHKYIPVNGSVERYFQEIRHVINPKEVKSRYAFQIMGPEDLNPAIFGEGLLVLFWSVAYSGMSHEQFVTSYLGYIDYDNEGDWNGCNDKVFNGYSCFQPIEFASWID